jgi:transcriptional regulator with XRE-family HTH domain
VQTAYGSTVAVVRKSQDGNEKNTLGPRLAQMRVAAGMSQDKLAAVLQRLGWDVSKATISAWENQSRSLTDIEIEKLLRAFKKTWADL